MLKVLSSVALTQKPGRATRRKLSVQEEGGQHFVWQLSGDTLQKTAVTIGARDPRRGTVQVLSGVSAGAQILRHPQWYDQ